LSPQMPGAPRRRDLVGGEGGRNANLESKEKLAIDGQLAYADGLAGGVPYGMYEQERSNDEDFALGENESALAPSPSSPPQEMQPQVSSQFLTKLKSANRGRRGALPVKISFNPPSDRYQATRFAVVLHDRNVPIRLRYTDLRWVAPVLALLFLIFPVCLIGYALGPDSSRFRKLSSLFLLMMSGLAAYSFELSGLETFSWFCASIPIGVLALPILALIRR